MVVTTVGVVGGVPVPVLVLVVVMAVLVNHNGGNGDDTICDDDNSHMNAAGVIGIGHGGGTRGLWWCW